MRDLWMDLCSQNATRADSFVRIDGFAWLNKVTLDIIGLAGVFIYPLYLGLGTQLSSS